MEYTKIRILTLNTFDKNNRNHLEFIKKLCFDDTIKTRFQGLTSGLFNNNKNEFFNHSFLVTHNATLIGYINISNYNIEERCIYLRAAIDKEKRGMSYGKILLSEITEYVFQKYPQVENIRLKIVNDNKASLMTAKANEYKWLESDIYIKYNPYIDKKKAK